jgi:thioredoxin reductase (NADPH)
METDILIIGAGPAGIQAAIHASRKKAKVLVVGRPEKSAIKEAWVENYCCTEKTLSGKEMLRDGLEQAKRFGTEFKEEDVIEAKRENGHFIVKLEGGEEIKSYALILAIGVTRNSANVRGEKEFQGRGVSYCVECDAGFYKGKKVAVLGDGSAAASGAVHLTKYAASVTLISRKLNVVDSLKAEIKEAGVIVRENSWLQEIKGNEKGVTSILLEDGTEEELDGVFIELGAKGAIELAVGLGVSLDYEQLKYIQTDKKQATNIPGIYAAGDICGAPFQLAKAVGEGCVAGTFAADFAKLAVKSEKEKETSHG